MEKQDQEKTQEKKEERGMTPEQADRYAPILADMKKYFESKDVTGKIAQMVEAQADQTKRISDVYMRIQGLETTVRSFMDYVKAEQTSTGGQGKITQAGAPRQGMPVGGDYADKGDLTAEALDSIQWQFNKRGEWTYSRKRDGSDSNDPTVQEVVYRIQNSGKPITLYGMEYSLSGENGMFLGRASAGGASRQQRGSGYSGGRGKY